MVDHKKRAERRRAFYESRLGDPRQLLRVIGSSTKLYPDAEQFYYHENADNLMPWQGNPDIKIDRFDGRSLLDFVPEKTQAKQQSDQHMMDELNFERYHDLVEAERLQVSEQERLSTVEEEWTKLLDRHKALLAMLNNSKKPEKGYAYDYGNTDDLHNEEESQLLKEADILQYVDDLTDKDKQILNDMAGKYGIRNYARLLRMTKKDRDDQLRDLKAKQGSDGKSKDKSRRSSRRRRHSRYEQTSPSRYGRASPTYEPYNNSSESSSSAEEEEEEEDAPESNVIIEFGSSSVVEQDEASVAGPSKLRDARERATSSDQQKDIKKLTPMEKLRLKMRAGLEKQIDSDERERKRQEREQELNRLRGAYKGERDDKSPVRKPARRYYSPSESGSERSPSPRKRRYRSPSSDDGKRRSRSRRRSRSPRRRSRKHHKRSRSRSSRHSRRR
ncbi:alternative splicing regulator-domain-containing protein [Fennellomyces sp. T-0311]|nr:alternative splicing regulator-domain-containing protein [Fennellomyces sp. T-0311]